MCMCMYAYLRMHVYCASVTGVRMSWCVYRYMLCVQVHGVCTGTRTCACACTCTCTCNIYMYINITSYAWLFPVFHPHVHVHVIYTLISPVMHGCLQCFTRQLNWTVVSTRTCISPGFGILGATPVPTQVLFSVRRYTAQNTSVNFRSICAYDRATCIRAGHLVRPFLWEGVL